MIDIKWDNLLHVKKDNKAFGDYTKMKNRTIELLDDFCEFIGKEIIVLEGWKDTESDKSHCKGQAIHIYSPEVDAFDLYIKALAYRGYVIHGPNFFSGVGFYLKVWEFKGKKIDGLHLDIRPCWSKRTIDTWGCVPMITMKSHSGLFAQLISLYPDWSTFEKKDGKVYLPIDVRFLSLRNILK